MRDQTARCVKVAACGAEQDSGGEARVRAVYSAADDGRLGPLTLESRMNTAYREHPQAQPARMRAHPGPRKQGVPQGFAACRPMASPPPARGFSRASCRHTIGVAAVGAFFVCSSVSASDAFPVGDAFAPGLYAVTTETLMPHLEESLRYATTHESHYFTGRSLATAFPILRHPSLRGCTLGDESQKNGATVFVLACSGTAQTAGEAVWQVVGNRVVGVLSVRLGGKNMTFSQRVTAVPLHVSGQEARAIKSKSA